MTDTATASTQPQAEKPKKKRRINLTGAILISLCLGIVVGIICSVTIPSGSTVDNILIEGVFYVLGQWFIRLMQMIVVPLVFCSIVCGAASMSDPKLLGKVGVGTILAYLLTTACAVGTYSLFRLIMSRMALRMSSCAMVLPMRS